ncbi:MAG: hypothetical protein WKG07_17860 [Hymenobacter sp.]
MTGQPAGKVRQPAAGFLFCRTLRPVFVLVSLLTECCPRASYPPPARKPAAPGRDALPPTPTARLAARPSTTRWASAPARCTCSRGP